MSALGASTLLAVAVLKLAPASAAFPLAAQAPTATFFTDPTGDSGVAPDITEVSVGNDVLTGNIVIWIDTPYRRTAFSTDLMTVFFDTDMNPSTGDPEFAGSEYAAQVLHGAALFRWSGSAMAEVPAPTLDYLFATERRSLRVSIHPNDIGGTRAFNFYLVSALEGQSATDVAPDGGAWSYSLVSEPLRLSVVGFATTKVARAGKPFSAIIDVGRDDTNDILDATGTRIRCSLKVGKKTVAAYQLSGIFTAGCEGRIPKKAKRQKLRMKISVKFGGLSISRTFAAKIR